MQTRVYEWRVEEKWVYWRLTVFALLWPYFAVSTNLFSFSVVSHESILSSILTLPPDSTPCPLQCSHTLVSALLSLLYSCSPLMSPSFPMRSNLKFIILCHHLIAI